MKETKPSKRCGRERSPPLPPQGMKDQLILRHRTQWPEDSGPGGGTRKGGGCWGGGQSGPANEDACFPPFQSFFSAVSGNPWGAFWPENERVLMKTTTWAALSDGENMEPSPEVVKSPSWTRLVTVEVMRKRWILDLF